MGLDDKIEDSDRFMEQRHVLGKKVIEDGYIPVARQYAKFGAPASLRPAIWRIILGLPEVWGRAECRGLLPRSCVPATDAATARERSRDYILRKAA